MIQVLGAENTREYDAAVALRHILLSAWPRVASDHGHDVRIVAGAKCHGQRIRDVDLLLLASFEPGLVYHTFLPFRGPDGHLVSSADVEVRSLCLAIELKDHRPEDVRFIGTAVEVIYNGRWHNASEQSEGQAFSVKNFLEAHRIPPPWVTALLWLRNIPAWTLPARPHPVLGAQLTWDLLLNVLAQLSPPRYQQGQWVMDAAQSGVSLPQVANLFTKMIEPTALDRQRMERINEKSADLIPIRDAVGSKLVILRGQGGTGKTMRLLQLAHQLVQDEGSRVLILTYNKALVADVRRLLAILGIDDDVAAGTIQVQTVHSFLYAALQGLEIIDPGERNFLEEYDRLKEEALSFLRSGAVTRDDIMELGRAHAEAFRWDYVFVDEGQDWPANERDLLRLLYPFTQLVIADGMNQLVRGETINWREGLARSDNVVFTLRKSLRMKAGLARFVTAVARNLGLTGDEWVPNEEIPGGRVILVDSPYIQQRSLQERLIRDNQVSGNLPVDMLFCVPPSLVVRASETSSARSVAADILEHWGFRTWDGASEDVRDSYPTETDQLRIVQYDSCRGLEGWITVHLGLDTFYQHKLRYPNIRRRTDNAVLIDDVTMAQRHAARWLLIALTRAMDTLVIQLDSAESPVRTALESAAVQYRDYVEWIRAD